MLHAASAPTHCQFLASVTQLIDDGETIEEGRDESKLVLSADEARQWASEQLELQMNLTGPWDPETQPTYWSARISRVEWDTFMESGDEWATFEPVGSSDSDSAWWDRDDAVVRWESQD